MSGTYKINGNEIDLQPTSGRWLPREVIAIDGNMQAIYPLYHEFECTWQVETPANFKELQDWFEGMSAIGNIVADLPEYGADTYRFFSYSGCVIREPEMGRYFTEHHTEVTLLISKIRV